MEDSLSGTKIEASDNTLIKETFKIHTLKLWKTEVKSKLRAKISDGLNDEEIAKLFKTFHGLNVFEKIPDYLRGKFYRLISNEKELFQYFTFENVSSDLRSFLIYALKKSKKLSKADLKFWELLLLILRNAYTEYNDFIAKLELKNFLNEKSLENVIRNIRRENFTIDQFDVFQKTASKINSENSLLTLLVLQDLDEYLKDEVFTEKISDHNTTTLKMMKKIMTSKDLKFESESDIVEIHIVCDILHIDEDLNESFKGKNVLVVGKTVKLHGPFKWDLSGRSSTKTFESNAGHDENGFGNNGENAEPGQNGGNFEIICEEIINPELWTIQSNGGNGSDGQDGGDGENGENGIDVQKEDFTINDIIVTNTNFIELLKNIDMNTKNTNWEENFQENGKEQILIFNSHEEVSEIFMLIKGTKGICGNFGGVGSAGGAGGLRGKINCINPSVKIVATEGKDGKDGLCGFNGQHGSDGRDAYLPLRSDDSIVDFVGLDKHKTFEISHSGENYLALNGGTLRSNLHIEEEETRKASTPERIDIKRISKLIQKEDHGFFIEELKGILSNEDDVSEQHEEDDQTDQDNQETSESADTQTDFNYKERILEVIKNKPKFCCNNYGDIVPYFLSLQAKNNNLYQYLDESNLDDEPNIDEAYVTSDNLENVDIDSNQLSICCGTLEITADLPKKFRGKNLFINATHIKVQNDVVWDLSGLDGDPIDFPKAGQNDEGNGYDGVNGNCGESGGNCKIFFDTIENPSKWKIRSNGGNGGNGQDGGDGRKAIDGIDANISRICINGKTFDSKLPTKFKVADENLTKEVVVESEGTYLMIIHGGAGQRGCSGGIGGVGGKGGYAGDIEIITNEKFPIKREFEHGKDGNNGKDGKTGDILYKNGKDFGILVKNGEKQFDEPNAIYEIKESKVKVADSVFYKEKYYYIEKKGINEFKEPKTKEELFCETLLAMIKFSNDLKSKPNIQEFVFRRCTPSEFLDKIKASHVDPFYRKLRKVIDFEKTEILDDFCKQTKIYFENPEILCKEKSYDISAAIITSKDLEKFKSLILKSEHEIVCIFCDVLHIDSNLPEQYRGKSLAIEANTVIVHKPCTWDLSGKEVSKEESNFIGDAGQNADGIGNDGVDGISGRNSGDFLLRCKFIKNEELLTLKLNGSDGINGQDGGNGEDGTNGRDATQKSFDVLDFKIISHDSDKISSGKLLNIKTHDGLNGQMIIKNKILGDKRLILVKGDNGKVGKPGGKCGLGGEGGKEGVATINCFKDQKSLNIKIDAKSGIPGKPGKCGQYGLRGSSGQDLWIYEGNIKNQSEIQGIGKKLKYKISFSKSKVENSIKDIDRNEYCFVEQDKCHLNSEVLEDIKIKNLELREKLTHAMSKTKTPYTLDILERNNSEYTNNISTIEYPFYQLTSQSLKTKAIDAAPKDKVVIAIDADVSNKAEQIMKSISLEFSLFDLNEQKKLLASPKNLDIITYSHLTEYTEFANIGNYKRKSAVGSVIVKISRDFSIAKMANRNQGKIESENLEAYLTDNVQEHIQHPLLDFLKKLDNHVKSHNFESDETSNYNSIPNFIPFLNNSKNFYNESKCFKWVHFGISTENLIDYFKEHVDQFDSAFLLTVFELLRKFYKKYTSLGNLTTEQQEKELKKIFKNAAFISSLENEFNEQGMISPIFRELFARKLGKRVSAFIEDINGDLKLFSQHNFEFVSEHTEDSTNMYHKYGSNDFFVLIHNEGAFVIYFGENKYEKFKTNSTIPSNFLQILQVLKSEECIENKEAVNNLIILEFSKRTKMQNQESIDSLKLDLELLSELETSIPIALAVRLFNGKSLPRIEEFSRILRSILDILSVQKLFSIILAITILKNDPNSWSVELIMIRLKIIYEDLNEDMYNEWKIILKGFKSKLILQLYIQKILSININEMNLNKNSLDDIIRNISSLNDDSYADLNNSKLLSWKLVAVTNKFQLENTSQAPLLLVFEDLITKYGEEVIELMTVVQEKMSDEDLKKLVIFFKNFSHGDWLLTPDIIQFLKTNPVEKWNSKLQSLNKGKNDRNVATIVEMIKSDSGTSENIKAFLKNTIETQKWNSFLNLAEHDILTNSKNLSSNTPTIELLTRIRRAIHLKTQGKITLRDTQLVSLLIMLRDNLKTNLLTQVSTGEGKTFIGLAFAIAKVVCGEKIDIITSSSVLAERDATDKVNRDVFELFGIKVDHNCHEDVERRKEAYKNSQVIYGTLGNFQRDYLLTEFFNENFISGHHYQNVLVDEVDSLLLDKANNILHLAQDIPDMDEVEGIFVLIWEMVNEIVRINNKQENLPCLNKVFLRKSVLDVIFGIVDENDIEFMNSDHKNDTTKIIDKLKNSGLIDSENMFVEQNYDEIKYNKALTEIDNETATRVKFYCREKCEKERAIKIPKYLKDFVLMNLNLWIQSAFRALIIQNEKEYVIDRKGKNEISPYPDIIIIDLDTGVDMTNSEWGNGLHQFLQLKHGCKLSLLNLKSVFISNVTYLKKYKRLFGMTGTLGNLEERNKIMEMHSTQFITIPRSKKREYIEESPILINDSKQWLDEIRKETDKVLESGRSVLIICETIKETKEVKKQLKEKLKPLYSKKIRTFMRHTDSFIKDYNTFEFDPGFVIIATNLAGRGTDLKLSKTLKENGGLHVILTYLPINARIENQAYGRAARAGDKGSGRLIIWDSKEKSILKLKQRRNNDELRKIDEIQKFYKNFIEIEEQLFEDFLKAHKTLKDEYPLCSEVYQNNFKLQWSFWLQKNSIQLNNYRKGSYLVKINEHYKKFESEGKSLHPVMRINLFKQLDADKNFSKAKIELSTESACDTLQYAYYKCYELLKTVDKIQTKKLTDDDEIEIRKCIKMLQSSISSRIGSIELIKILKKKYDENRVPVEAFEDQQKSFQEVLNVLNESVARFIGTDVNADTFECETFDKEFMRSDLYEELMRLGCLTRPRISAFFTDEDIKHVVKNYDIMFCKLKEFLDCQKGKDIESMRDFQYTLKSEFELPNVNDFWKILIKNGILRNEVEFATVDINAIKVFDPSAESIIKSLNTLENNQTLNVTLIPNIINIDVKMKANVIIVNKKELHSSKLSQKRLERLEEFDVIKINKRAQFDEEKYEELKNVNIFDKFNEINIENLNFHYVEILKKLTCCGIFIERTPTTLGLSSILVTLDMLDEELGHNVVYKNEIFKIIKANFAYGIALKNLAKDVKESRFEGITLNTNPHLQLIYDLIQNMIIEQSKVNPKNIGRCKKIFQSPNASDYFEKIGFECDKALNKYYAKYFKKGSKFPPMHKSNEDSIKLMLSNRKTLIKNVQIIMDTLKHNTKPQDNDDIEKLKIILESINMSLPDNRITSLIELKGLGNIISYKNKKSVGKLALQYGGVFLTIITKIGVCFVLSQLLVSSSPNIWMALAYNLYHDICFLYSSIVNDNFSFKNYLKYTFMKTVAEGINSICGVVEKIITTLEKANTGLKLLNKPEMYVPTDSKDLVKPKYDPIQTNYKNLIQIAKPMIANVGKIYTECDKSLQSKVTFILTRINSEISNQIESVSILSKIGENPLDTEFNDRIKNYFEIINFEQKFHSNIIYAEIKEYIMDYFEQDLETRKHNLKDFDYSIISAFIQDIVEELEDCLSSESTTNQLMAKTVSSSIKSKVTQMLQEKMFKIFSRLINQLLSNYLKVLVDGNLTFEESSKNTTNDAAIAKKVKRMLQKFDIPSPNVEFIHEDPVKFIKILQYCKNPELYSKLTRHFVPLTRIGIESMIKFLECELKIKIKIFVSHKEIEYKFGSIDDRTAKIIRYDEIKSYYEEGGCYDFLYTTACKHFESRKITLREFNNAIADIMINNSEIISKIINNNRNEYAEMLVDERIFLGYSLIGSFSEVLFY